MHKLRLLGLLMVSLLAGLSTSFAADTVHGPSIHHGVSLSGHVHSGRCIFRF